MANARVKRVASSLADLYSRPRYIADYLSNLRQPLFRGDTIEVPSIGTLTVAQASVGQTAQDVANQAVNPNVLSLVANQEPAIFVEVQANQDIQVMDGAYFDQVAFQGLSQLRNSIDGTIAYTIASQTCWDTVGTYHDNVAGAALTPQAIANSKANLMALDGAHNLALFVHAFGEGNIVRIPGFIPNFTLAQQGVLGIPQLGSVYGVPVYQANSITQGTQAIAQIAASASNIASNVCTFTVPANHGLVPGELISTTGFTNNITNVAITSVTATTVVAPVTGSNGSNGTGTITEQSTWNLLIDLPHLYIALQKMPSVREVPYFNRTSNSLQLSALYGTVFRQGRARVLHSPLTA